MNQWRELYSFTGKENGEREAVASRDQCCGVNEVQTAFLPSPEVAPSCTQTRRESKHKHTRGDDCEGG